MIWENIDVNTGIRFNSGGESAGQYAQNIIMRGLSSSDLMTIYGVQIIGSKNILLQYINNGPSNQCAKNDPGVPEAWRCDPDGPWFEAQYADVGTVTGACDMQNGNHTFCGGFWANGGSEWSELYIHDGGAGGYENIRLEHFINHDQTSIQDSTAAAHPGCLMHFGGSNVVQTAHNAVLDHYVCERPAGASVQFADSGWTIQNSVFGCQVQSLQNSGGVWDGSCIAVPFGFGVKSSTGGTGATNVLIRYSYFGSGAGSSLAILTGAGWVNNFSNIRIVGNVFAGGVTCGVTGVTYANNAFVNGVSTCGSPAEALGAGDPIANSSYDQPAPGYKLEGATIDPSADGSPALTNLNPTSLNTTCGCTDYTLDHDFEGDARSSTATKPGADG
jgi:hypothetical protein